MSLRKPLRTFTRAALAISRFLLVYVLCLSMVLLPVPLARADFPDADGNFTLWLEAGRASHSFEIWDPTYYGPYYTGSGSLVQPGGTRLTGTLPVGASSFVMRDTTSGEIAQLPNDANGEAHIPRTAWSSESNNPIRTLYFLVGYERMWDSLIVSQPNGTYYVANLGAQWIQGSQEYLMEYSAPYDPTLPYRILDLTTGQQSEENVSDLSLSAWSPITAPVPLADVTFVMDSTEAGHWFTIHSQYPGGLEMLKRVQAGATGNRTMGCTGVSASIGCGMNVRIERDADHVSVGGMHVDVGSMQQDFWLSTYGSFPAVPDRGHPLVAQQFRILDSQMAGGMGNPDFTLWMADGYHTDISVFSTTNGSSNWTKSPLYDDLGAIIPGYENAVWNLTLDVDPQQSEVQPITGPFLFRCFG